MSPITTLHYIASVRALATGLVQRVEAVRITSTVVVVVLAVMIAVVVIITIMVARYTVISVGRRAVLGMAMVGAVGVMEIATLDLTMLGVTFVVEFVATGSARGVTGVFGRVTGCGDGGESESEGKENREQENLHNGVMDEKEYTRLCRDDGYDSQGEEW